MCAEHLVPTLASESHGPQEQVDVAATSVVPALARGPESRVAAAPALSLMTRADRWLLARSRPATLTCRRTRHQECIIAVMPGGRLAPAGTACYAVAERSEEPRTLGRILGVVGAGHPRFERIVRILALGLARYECGSVVGDSRRCWPGRHADERVPPGERAGPRATSLAPRADSSSRRLPRASVVAPLERYAWCCVCRAKATISLLEDDAGVHLRTLGTTLRRERRPCDRPSRDIRIAWRRHLRQPVRARSR